MKDIAGVSNQSSNIFNIALLSVIPIKSKFGTDTQAHPIPGIILIIDVRNRILKVIA